MKKVTLKGFSRRLWIGLMGGVLLLLVGSFSPQEGKGLNALQFAGFFLTCYSLWMMDLFGKLKKNLENERKAEWP